MQRFFLLALLLVFPAASFAAGEKSLHKCQKTAAKEAGKYAANYQKTVAKCLDKIARERIKDAAGDAAGAAKSCKGALGKLVNSDAPAKALAAKAAAKIAKVCDPLDVSFKGDHGEADVLGSGIVAVTGDTLQAEDTGAWCATHGVGGGTIATVSDWIDCQLAAATCGARQLLAGSYPNVSVWLADVRGDIEAIDPNDVDVIDALTALDALDGAIDAAGDTVPDLACGFVDGIVAGRDPIVPATGQTTSFGAGTDGDVQAGQARSFVDNGDGTIFDEATGLLWEAKDDAGGLHDKDTLYSWCSDVAPFDFTCDDPNYPMDGTLTSDFLDKMNNTCDGDESTPCTVDGDCAGIGNELCGHAGYRDWRIPNPFELVTLSNWEATSPSAFNQFNSGSCTGGCALPSCSCTALSGGVHTSSTMFSLIDFAWGRSPVTGHIAFIGKSGGAKARAVRGGL